jgi:hypothetical protein
MTAPKVIRIGMAALASSAILVGSSLGQQGANPRPGAAEATVYTPPPALPSAS